MRLLFTFFSVHHGNKKYPRAPQIYSCPRKKQEKENTRDGQERTQEQQKHKQTKTNTTSFQKNTPFFLSFFLSFFLYFLLYFFLSYFYFTFSFPTFPKAIPMSLTMCFGRVSAYFLFSFFKNSYSLRLFINRTLPSKGSSRQKNKGAICMACPFPLASPFKYQ